MSRASRLEWRTWARGNPVMLENGDRRVVSAEKAFSIVIANRALAGEAVNVNTRPAPTTWLVGALSVRDAGVETAGSGVIAFRLEQTTTVNTKWFVWASALTDGAETDPRPLMRYITCLAVPPTENYEGTPYITGYYTAVHGSFLGPGPDGAWPTPKYVWFRLHQYVDGQLGPMAILKARLFTEL